MVRRLLISMGLMAVVLLPVALSADAAAVNVFKEACSGSPSAVCPEGTSGNTGGDLIKDVINLLFYAIGIIAVIVIVVGGIKYVVSDGDSGKIKSAKETILYAIVGLVVALLGSAIVNFVVGRFS